MRVRGEEGGNNSSDMMLCLSSLAETLGVSGKPVHFSLSLIHAENIPKSGYKVAFDLLALDVLEVPVLACK